MKNLFVRAIMYFSRRGLLNWVKDETYIKYVFKKKIGHSLNLANPKTYNEKLQWLKLYDRDTSYKQLVDKYAVRDYVARTIGKQYVIPLIAKWDNPDDIDFNILPSKYVLKCNHDSGGIVIKDGVKQFAEKEAIKKLKKSFRNDGYGYGREWPYKDMKKCIIAEEYLRDDKTGELRDYKFFCFNGKVHYFKIDFDRFISHKANYYDRQADIQPFGEIVCPPDYNKKLEIPNDLDKMIELAEKLSIGHPFIRVDFYYVNGQIYFGELTFFPGAGFVKILPEEYDIVLGDLIDLDLVKGKNMHE